jgi:signal transduction histidine kinase
VPKRVVSPPYLSIQSHQDLSLDSTLQELPLYDFSVESSCLGVEVAQMFEKYPRLPGVILVEQEEFIGMISRQRFLEFLLRPHGMEIFLHEPLQVLYSYARAEVLVLRGSKPILAAAQQALRRSRELLAEPIVVQTDSNTYQLLDTHELNIAYWQIRGIETQVRYERAQAQMIQIEKMASLGRLVDGLAHEILDPVGFIWGNLTHISSYSEGLLHLMAIYEAKLIDASDEITAVKEEIEFDFLQQDLSRAIGSIKTGADRLKKLATSLQNFCHIDEVYPKPADLNNCLDSIILLLKSRISSEIEIVKNYGLLPPVPCYIGQLNQVFMNIISNAVNVLLNQAIHQKWAKEFPSENQKISTPKPRIEITTTVCSSDCLGITNSPEVRWVSIKIADNGPGLSAKTQKQILESFSIAKRAEKETSLALSYRIVTAKHGGKFLMRSPIFSVNGGDIVSSDIPASPELQSSPPAFGTEFEILLPLL